MQQHPELSDTISYTSGTASTISEQTPSPPATPRNTMADKEYFAAAAREQQRLDDLTMESMSSTIAAAVQISSGKSASSLSLGNASIIHTERTKKEQKRRSSSVLSLFGGGGGGGCGSSGRKPSVDAVRSRSNSTAAGSPTTTTSPRASRSSTSSRNLPARLTWLAGEGISEHIASRSNSEFDDGLDELMYRGIKVKEIKSTLKTMVVPNEVKNPMPVVKLQRPGFARINN